MEKQELKMTKEKAQELYTSFQRLDPEEAVRKAELLQGGSKDAQTAQGILRAFQQVSEAEFIDFAMTGELPTLELTDEEMSVFQGGKGARMGRNNRAYGDDSDDLDDFIAALL